MGGLSVPPVVQIGCPITRNQSMHATEKKLPQKTLDTSSIDKLGDMLQILGDVLTVDTDVKTEVVAGNQDEIDENKCVLITSDQSVNEESQDSLTSYVVEVKGQEFIVTKPTPLIREISSRSRQQKVVSTEVAGNDGRSDLPQLMRIKRLDSEQIHQLESRMSDDEVFDKHPKPEKHVLFKEPAEVEKSKILHHVVIGGVLQTIPAESVSSTTNVKMRPKPSSKTKLNRRVSCKDLGQGECEGWLYKKKQKHGTLSKHWDKRWCVLKNSNLFYYKHKDDDAAEGVIHLPAFFVSPAPNLKTKKFAFKIHNGGTSFHFASERQDDMSKWMNKMGLAAISYTQHLHNQNNLELTLPTAKDGKPSVSSIDSKAAFYSESEGDDDDASIHGSCLSLDSTSSPQTSPATRKHPTLEEIKNSSIGTSTEELHAMLRSIEKQNLTIDGKNKIRQRQSQITSSNELLEACGSATIERYRKLHSLHRTLKAKEMELQQLEAFLEKPVMSSSELHTFLESHCTENHHIIKKKTKVIFMCNKKYNSKEFFLCLIYFLFPFYTIAFEMLMQCYRHEKMTILMRKWFKLIIFSSNTPFYSVICFQPYTKLMPSHRR
ncbi:hypothetical protein Btru_033905 [Bulinus truncatus]|nr:hypothetical protein Btru_033905 [Bulinus truncatus]